MRLTWDNIGEKFYKIGLDHGVIYPYYDGLYHAGIAWNGLSGIDPNKSGNEVTKLYSGDTLDGILLTTEEFGGVIRCFTYPDEFEECLGNEEVVPGMYINAQDRINFGLCYRTLIGSDVSGTNAGFDLHIVYNSIVTGDDSNETTFSDSVNPSEFQFTFSSIPEEMDGYFPVSHVVISSLKVDETHLNELLDVLYGTDETDPYLPLPDELVPYIASSSGSATWNGYPSSAIYPSNTIFPYGGS